MGPILALALAIAPWGTLCAQTTSARLERLPRVDRAADPRMENAGPIIPLALATPDLEPRETHAPADLRKRVERLERLLSESGSASNTSAPKSAQPGADRDGGKDQKTGTGQSGSDVTVSKAKDEDPPAEKPAKDEHPKVNWAGQLQTDTYWFEQDQASRDSFGEIPGGEAFRRARIAVFGTYGLTEYRIGMDFALSGRPSFLDVYAGLHELPGIGRIRVGHFFEPFCLERNTANMFVTFMERSMIDQAFAPGRNTGIMANNTWMNDRATWGLGYFRTDSDVYGDDVGTDFENAVSGRLTGVPIYDEWTNGHQYVHLGMAYSIRAANDRTVRFRAQPEARLGAAIPNVPFFVDTGSIPSDFFQLLGGEVICTRGPFSIQSEYMLSAVDSISQGDLYFHGCYLFCSYFLTGEHRPYRRDNGTVDRVIPLTDFVQQGHDSCVEVGPGAWELVARLSYLDLNDATVQGGELTDVTVGLNWYLNPYLRVTTNYIHAFANDPTVGGSGTNIFAMRFGFDF